MRSYAGASVDDDDDEDDDIIEMRSSSHRNHTNPKSLFRSQSKVSTASSSSSTSTASTTTTDSSASSSHASTDTTSPAGSLSPCRTNRKPSPSSSSTATARRSSSSTYRPSNTYTTRRGQPVPSLMRTPEQVHFTIAPIAPTILKTTGVWSEGFGDEEGNEDEFGSWDTKGLWPGQDTYAGNGKKGKGKIAGLYGSFGLVGESDKEGQSSDGTPVELVYVPPFESNYSLGIGDDDGSEEYKEPEEYRDAIGRTRVHQNGVTVALTDGNGPSTLSPSGPVSSRGSSRTRHHQWSSTEEEYGCYAFGGPDLGEDYYYARRSDQGHDGVFPSLSSVSPPDGGRLSTSGSDRQRERERERRTVVQGGEERQSRARSRSQSRTPSPAFISSTAPTPTVSNGQVSSGRKKCSASATPSAAAGPMTNDFLSPPVQRGRAVTPSQSQSQLLSQPQSRGRSSTRTASSSSSWDREVGNSPMVNLSFDGLVRAGGREREKEKERESERGRERRGRERTSEKMLAGSEIETAASSGARAGSGSSTRTTRDVGKINNRVVPDSSTISSCSSSTSTVMGPPPSGAIVVDIRPINKEQEHRTNPPPTKFRPPPLIPPPPLLAKPSTSLTAVSSPSPASPIISTFTTSTSNKGLASPTASSGEHSIVGKAVDIVSSAGAFLGLWHSSKSEE